MAYNPKDRWKKQNYLFDRLVELQAELRTVDRGSIREVFLKSQIEQLTVKLSNATNRPVNELHAEVEKLIDDEGIDYGKP